MAEIELAGQLQYSSRFYQPAAKIGNVADDFFAESPKASLPGVVIKRRVGVVGSAAVNTINQFQIPARNLVGDVWLEISLGATGSGNYCDIPCAALITNVKVSHSSNVLHNYNYRPIYSALQSLQYSEVKDLYATIGGGTGSGAAVVGYAPIPCGWTSFRHDRNDFPPPLPLGASDAYLSFEITLDTIANILASGATGGSLVNATLIYYEIIPTPDEMARIKKLVQSGQWNMLCYDFQTNGANSTVATGTSSPTAIDITGMQGDIVSLFLPAVTSTNWDTNHNYFRMSNSIVYIDLWIDSTPIYQSVQGTNNELLLDVLSYNGQKVGRNSTYSECQMICFARRPDSDSVWCASLNTQIFKKFTLNVEQSSGGNLYINPTIFRNVYFTFSQGLFLCVR